MSGQTLVFMPVVLLVITVFFCITYNVSWYAKKRIALQEAADSAALAGARVQDMMLEAIATGNDAIAWNIGMIVNDFASLGDPAQDVQIVEDIIKRINWIQSIQGTQDFMTQDTAMAFTEAATMFAGPAAGADLTVALPASGTNLYGFSIPTSSSNPGTNVERPWWTLFAFVTRKSNTPFVPLKVLPKGGFTITEKPVVFAFGNIPRQKKDSPFEFYSPLGLPVPIIPNAQGTSLVATSAAAVYFVPWGPPMNRDWMSNSPAGSATALTCLMIPGPFWGARLDEVGAVSAKGNGIGGAVWFAQRLISKYPFAWVNGYFKTRLLGNVEGKLWNALPKTESIEMETFVESGEEL